MIACPLTFSHPAEAQQLQGLGTKLCTRLYDELKKHCEKNGLPLPKKCKCLQLHSVHTSSVANVQQRASVKALKGSKLLRKKHHNRRSLERQNHTFPSCRLDPTLSSWHFRHLTKTRTRGFPSRKYAFWPKSIVRHHLRHPASPENSIQHGIR